jgi:hypothetical protein
MQKKSVRCKLVLDNKEIRLVRKFYYVEEIKFRDHILSSRLLSKNLKIKKYIKT